MHRLGSANGSSRSAVTGARIRASAPCISPRCSEHTTSWWRCATSRNGHWCRHSRYCLPSATACGLGTALVPPVGTTVGGRPVLNLSLAANYAVSGTAVGSYHAVNLATHILAGLTLFGIVRRTLAPRTG